jgi:HlyD family secretion protein
MTANVAIIVAQKDQVLRVPNAALRFSPPAGAERQTEEVKAMKADGRGAGSHPSAMPGDAGGTIRKIWKLTATGDLEPLLIHTGITDGLYTEVTTGSLAEGDQVVVGVEVPRGDRRSSELPPGFGSGQRRSRDRGL